MQYMTQTHLRRLPTLLTAVVLSVSVAACGDESTGPEAGADVQDIVDESVAGLEEDIETLEGRIEALESDEVVVEDPEGIGREDANAQAFGFEEFAADSDQYVGQEVTVSGTVSSVTGDHAFTIGGDDIGGEALLVVSSSNVGQQQLVEQGAVVQVTGTVEEQFSPDTAASDLGIEWDDPEAFGDFQGENYLVAENVSEAPEMTEQG